MRFISVLALLATAACGGGDDGDVRAPASIELAQTTIKISKRERLLLRSRLLDQDGVAVAGATIAYTSSAPSVVSVDGLYLTGVAAGSATITAESGGLRAEAAVTVRPGPDARWLPALVYDPVHQQVVLHGGNTDQATHRDTWAWDGAAWRLLDETGPPRFGHVLVWDSTRQRVVLVGGGDDGDDMLTDVWEWDGTHWGQRPAEGSARWPPRRHFTAGYDPARKRVVVFGGFDELGAVYDTWEWDGARWERRAEAGPAMLILPSRFMVWSAARQRLRMLVGDDNADTNDTWEWDGSAWTVVTGGRVRVEPPTTIVGTASDGEILLVDEDPDAATGCVTYRFDGAAWTQLAAAGPPRRFVSGVAYDAARGQVVLFGGAGMDGLRIAKYWGDTWVWNGTAWSQAD